MTRCQKVDTGQHGETWTVSLHHKLQGLGHKTQVIIEALTEVDNLGLIFLKMMEATDFLHSTIHRYSNLLDDSVRNLS